MPAGHTEYALPYIFPWAAPAAAFTAQWQAQDTSAERPAGESSQAAPRNRGGGAPPRPHGGRPRGDPLGLELVVEALRGEEAALLGHPLLQPHVRLDPEHHL